MVSQNSVDNIPCIPISFADFFCGCGKDPGKERNKIKKIASRKLSRVNKRSKMASRVGCERYKSKDESKGKRLQTTKVSFEQNGKRVSNLPGLREPIDLDSLNLNGAIKHLLANVKISSVLGCTNVPKTMSQIKILLANSPSLKSQLKHILGDNLKNDNLKAIAELLESEEEECTDACGDSPKPCLSISKSVLNASKDRKSELQNPSDVLPLKQHCSGEKNDRVKKNRKKFKNSVKNVTKKSSVSVNPAGLFSSFFSSVFHCSKSSSTERKMNAVGESTDIPKKISRTNRNKPFDDAKMKEMRLKYDEWYKRSPEEVRERFRWEDYVRVTIYLNDIKENSLYKDPKTREMLKMWLRKFSQEINRHRSAEDLECEERLPEKEENEPHSDELLYGSDSKLQRLHSDEMLNAGGGNIVDRLNSLLKELMDRNEHKEEYASNMRAAEGEADYLPHTNYAEDPGCSNRPEAPITTANDSLCESKPVANEASLLKMICSSFATKLSKHSSRDDKSSVSSRYGSDTPWQNKDFQVFCVPVIETNNSFDVKTDGDSSTEFSGESESDDENISENYEKRDRSIRTEFPNSGEVPTASKGREPILDTVGNSKDGINYRADHVKTTEIRNSQPKRVSFEDENNSEHFVTEYSSFEYSEKSVNADGEDSTGDKNIEERGSCSSLAVNNEATDDRKRGSEASSSYSDLDQLLQLVELTLADKLTKNSSESIGFIKRHKSELIHILEYLVSLDNRDPCIFQPEDHRSVFVVGNPSVGIQCELSKEFGDKRGPRFRFVPKSFSANGAVKFDVESDSARMNIFKLPSTSSDSGVHSKSSDCSRRRQCTSLPDVLDGASSALVGRLSQEEKSSQENDRVNREDLITPCLSTSLSCQASQLPDMDDLSQAINSFDF